MDQCQNIRAEVAKAQDVYDSLIKSSGPPDFKKPVGVAEALQTLNLKKANLAACIKAHIPFTITGDTPKPGSALTEFDKAIENFCRANNVRAGQLTILKGGIKKFEHGYTLAEPLYPITQVDSLFRIASVSKAFTCACIQTLQDQKKVKLVDAVFPLLGITKKALAGQNPDPNINKITVGNLVNHLGGWNDQGAGFFEGKKPVSSSSDPVFHIRQIATQMNLTRPPTKMDMARFMYGEPLQFTPGAAITGPKNYCYSNFGYMLLGLVVEKRSGMPYIDFLRQQVLAPIGVTDVFLARMLAGPIPREVTYDDAGSGLNALEPHANVTAPNPYGGFGAVTELMDFGRRIGSQRHRDRTIHQQIHGVEPWPRPRRRTLRRNVGDSRLGAIHGRRRSDIYIQHVHLPCNQGLQRRQECGSDRPTGLVGQGRQVLIANLSAGAPSRLGINPEPDGGGAASARAPGRRLMAGSN